MNPALFASFAARFGPWFGRMVAASPSLLAKLVSKLRLSDTKAVIGNSVSEVVAYAKSNPVTATLTLATLTQLGMSVSDLFGGTEAVTKLNARLDDESRNFLGTLLERERASASSDDAYDVTVKAADHSASLTMGIAEMRSQLETTQEILRFAVALFSGAENALKAHRLLQAFMEMPHDDVGVGLATLRI